MSAPRKSSLTSKLHLIVLMVIAAVVITFALVNFETVEVNLVFARVEMPRFLLIVGVFLSGAAVGWLSRTGRKA